MIHHTSPLVIGNWKMNPATLADAKQLFVNVRQITKKVEGVTVAVAPPAVFLSDASRLSPSGRLGIVAQSVHPEAAGAHTGEVSVPMVVSAGATYVLIGHSERRANGINDDGVRTRLQAVWREKVTPIVCVGEQVRDNSGDYLGVIEGQLQQAFAEAKKAQVKRTIIAYEPVWAIGSGQTATPEDVQEMRLFIEKCLTKLFDRGTAHAVPILYGGSVNDQNAKALYEQGGVDGFLVGGASLQPKKFAGIISAVMPK